MLLPLLVLLFSWDTLNPSGLKNSGEVNFLGWLNIVKYRMQGENDAKANDMKALDRNDRR